MYSSLVDFTRSLEPNCDKGNFKKDMVTIHHMAGALTPDSYIATAKSRRNSANYSVYSDGTVVGHIQEEYRSWCSSSAANDRRAITIEVANNSGAPNWTISKKAWDSLVRLLADISERHKMGGFRFLNDCTELNNPEKQNVTLHRWFSATACPGPYLYENMKSLCDDANRLIDKNKRLYKVQVGAFSKKENADKFLKEVQKNYPSSFINKE